MPPHSSFQAVQCNIHNPGPLQAEHSLSQLFTHPADLQIKSLGEYNAKLLLCYRVSNTRLGDSPQYGNTGGHRFQEGYGHRLIYCYPVFLLMLIFRTHHGVNDISVVSEQDQTLRMLIQPSYSKDA
ncbi:hypothetical protein D3C76_1543450 [compost metagenome]